MRGLFDALPDSGSRLLKLVGKGAETRQTWREVIARTPWVTATQTPTWLDLICDSAPYVDATRLYERADGTYVVLPMVRHRRSPAAAPVEQSWPLLWDYCGPIFEGIPGGSLQDVAGLVADLASTGAARLAVRVRLEAREQAVWDAAVPATVWRRADPSQVLDLSGGFAKVWHERFTSKARSASRKALRRGVTVAWDSTGAFIPAFDELYRRSVVRWATDRREPARLRLWLSRRREPTARFAEVAERYGDACRVWLAFRDREPIAGLIVLTQGAHATYWRGAMDKEKVIGTGANELLHRSVIEHACANGVVTYDLGLSPSESLARFKRSLGAQDVAVVTYCFERLPLTTLEGRVRSTLLQTVRRLSRLQAIARR